MRLIDADALADEMMKSSMPSHDIGGRYQTGFMDARSMVISAPTIDPVKHGKWIERERYRTTKDGVFHTYRYKVCSICGRASGRRMNKRTRYCPHCGAHMRGEQDG